MNRVTITLACAIVALLVGCEQAPKHAGIYTRQESPAVHVGTVHEDGSFTFTVKDATCYVPNTDEEHIAFNVPCSRKPTQ